MRKKHCLPLAVCMLFCISLYAENPPDESQLVANAAETQERAAAQKDEVYLPDLVTVIGGEDWQVAEAALPDYQVQLPEAPPEPEQAIPEPLEDGPLPELPPSVVELASARQAKEFFLEGFIEPAWPLSLDTAFSVFTADPQAFFLDFGYKTVGGYGLEQAEDGFFHNKSFLQVGKRFLLENAALQIQGSYKSMDNGLQGQSLLFDDVNRRGVGVQLWLGLPLGHGISMAGGLPVDWFNRYAGFSNTVGRIEENEVVAVSILGLSPWLSFNWDSESFDGGTNDGLPRTHEFSAQLLVDWNYRAALDPGVGIAQNRGSVVLSGSWLWNSSLEIFSSLGLVYLPAGSGQDKTKLLVPFALGMGWNANYWKEPGWQLKENSGENAPRESLFPLSFSMEGGLDSRYRNFYQLEAAAPYVNFSPQDLIANGEESDWFLKARSRIPFVLGESSVFQELFLQLGLEYRQSAFGNNVLAGDYAAGIDGWTGLFPAEAKARKALFSELAVTVVVSNFLFKAGWNSQWLYRPVYEPSQRLLLSGGYDSPNHPWGATLKADFGFMGTDSLPLLSAQVYYKPAENLRLALCFKDMLKLFSGKQRVFVEPYMKEGGSVALSLQFNF